MFKMIIVGAGPAGISMAAEAASSGIDATEILVLETAPEHSWSIRKFYAEDKTVTANFKGKEAICTGVMCITDTTKGAFLSYIDQAIDSNGFRVNYGETVDEIHKEADGHFTIRTGRDTYQTTVCVIAIGILGKPKKPDYKISPGVKRNIQFDITSKSIEDCSVLVVGGGDSASEYVQFLQQTGNRVTLSYRKSEFTRLNDINRQSLLALERKNAVSILRSSNIVALEKDGERVRVTFDEENIEDQAYDRIVYALGGTTPENFLAAVGIRFEGQEVFATRNFETNVPGLFLIGDLSGGKRGGSIISAFNSAHHAMTRICEEHLGCSVVN